MEQLRGIGFPQVVFCLVVCGGPFLIVGGVMMLVRWLSQRKR